jgi:hypothetical protein
MVFSLVTALAAGAVSVSVPSVRDLVIRSVTINPQTKVATVRGAVTCTRAESVELFVDVRQAVGRLHTVSASGAKELDCDGRVSFSLRLRNEQGRLGPALRPLRHPKPGGQLEIPLSPGLEVCSLGRGECCRSRRRGSRAEKVETVIDETTWYPSAGIRPSGKG